MLGAPARVGDLGKEPDYQAAMHRVFRSARFPAYVQMLVAMS